MAFHHTGETSIPTQALQWATVNIQETKVILMGNRQIDILDTKQMGFAILQNHYFTCKWQWELMLVGDLTELVVDIQAGDRYAVSNGSYQAGWGAAA